MNTARIPRHREPVLPRWGELPSLVRIAVGVVVGVLLLWGAR